MDQVEAMRRSRQCALNHDHKFAIRYQESEASEHATAWDTAGVFSP